MKYISLFSGIEAATVAWKPLGWECVAVSEIDPFACAVLKHHYPNTPNLGDITKITKEQLHDIKKIHTNIDILIGGSPCQSFSMAGLRKGLNDPRGNLMLEYIRVVDIIKPTYFIWENVPGVLSSNKGRDFGTLIQSMAELGYSLAWRTLDSKNFGVPQRRRRVFLVGCLGNNKRPFEILFEPKSSQRNHQKSREKRQDNTTKTTSSTQEHNKNTFINSSFASYTESHIGGTLKANGGDFLGGETLVTEKQYASTICSRDHKGLASDSFGHDSQHAVIHNSKVRRLTLIECERLQGFPDNYTQIPWRNKEAKDCPMSHRYRCLGNSMTTNVIKWIGEQI
tara:strand:+ start:952 stop:1968 length:1017 start_codon:yes stop_codon:yes gene_type:complete